MSEVPPEVYTEDETIWPLMVQLSQCLCETLTARGLMPGDCFCGVLPGDQVAHDYGSGQAWVRLTGIYPTTTFPQIDNTLRGSCSAALGATLEVGVMQCAPGLGALGSLPDEADQFEATRLQMATMRAMRQAIVCCGIEEMVLGQYSPQGPQGLLVGGTWLVDVLAEN
jgi:hypothetical protein